MCSKIHVLTLYPYTCGQIIITSSGFSIQFLWIFNNHFWMGKLNNYQGGQKNRSESSQLHLFGTDLLQSSTSFESCCRINWKSWGVVWECRSQNRPNNLWCVNKIRLGEVNENQGSSWDGLTCVTRWRAEIEGNRIE